MHTRGIQNIIFDLGNTLVYYDFCYFYDRLAQREIGLNAFKLRKFIIDNKYDIKVCKGILKHKDFFTIVKKKFKLRTSYSDFTYFYADIFWANSSMKIFLERIARIKKFKLFLMSNTDPVHINFLDKNFPFVKIIRNRILSYKAGHVKPQKVFFKYALKKYKLIPKDTVLIDDIKKNIIAAKSAGMNAIHYTNHKKFLKQFGMLLRSR